MAFWISRVCEEFGCLPSAAEAELNRQPVGWLEEIIEARRYAETKRAFDGAKDKRDVPLTLPLYAVVKAITFDLAEEELEKRG